MFNDYSDVVNINELCKMLDIGKNTAYELVNTGKVKSIRIGKKIKIAKPWVIEYVQSVSC